MNRNAIFSRVEQLEKKRSSNSDRISQINLNVRFVYEQHNLELENIRISREIEQLQEAASKILDELTSIFTSME